jgi:hypothetical protein
MELLKKTSDFRTVFEFKLFRNAGCCMIYVIGCGGRHDVFLSSMECGLQIKTESGAKVNAGNRGIYKKWKERTHMHVSTVGEEGDKGSYNKFDTGWDFSCIYSLLHLIFWNMFGTGFLFLVLCEFIVELEIGGTLLCFMRWVRTNEILGWSSPLLQQKSPEDEEILLSMSKGHPIIVSLLNVDGAKSSRMC